jgi:hypothetical protein
VVERVLGPVDAASAAVDERDMRTRRLEVEESLGLDVRETLRIPRLGEIAAGE